MTESRQTQITKKKRRKKQKEAEDSAPPATISDDEKKRKLKELDEFMEGVLQKAGEEFLDEFRQMEGE